ncbi:GATA transcription factor 9 [Zostera marina]|uniref:GATA transcription factor n=1 Tax=Zostera marina TaxID=29655 RepID=A0A0K9NN16_ZOSMR|nr:GATA transcription factor 9 [Zostera marina]
MGPELEMGMGFGRETIGNSNNAYLYGLQPSSVTETLQIDDLLDFSTTQEGGGFETGGGGDNGGGLQGGGGHHFQQMMPMQYASTGNINSGTGNNVNATSAGFAGAGNCGGLGGVGINGGFGTGPDLLPAFPEDLYMPSEETAELEWLSKFVEDSFSDLPFPSPTPTMGNFSNVNPPVTNTADENNRNNNGNSRTIGNLHNHNSVPGRARSKRSRAPGPVPSTHLAAPSVTTTWSSLPPPQLCASTSSSSSSSSETKQRGGGGTHGVKKKESTMGVGGPAMEKGGGEGGVRRCTHCSSEKTPQWRTGPLGPKTLCNACGVRFKSGRLVPEYRPAASPTFVLTQHSNSHRKVVELRRQKELVYRHQAQNHLQNNRETSPSTTNGTTASATRPDLLLRDYEVC